MQIGIREIAVLFSCSYRNVFYIVQESEFPKRTGKKKNKNGTFSRLWDLKEVEKYKEGRRVIKKPEKKQIKDETKIAKFSLGYFCFHVTSLEFVDFERSIYFVSKKWRDFY